MAEFDQSPATRAAMQDAARSYVESHANVTDLRGHILSTPAKVLAAQAGVGVRQAQRWQAQVRGSESQKRGFGKGRLEKLAAAAPGKVRMKLDATLVIGGDPTYSRRRTGIVVDFSDEEAAEMVSEALSDDEENQDEAWQTFFDVYVCPAGFVEQPRIQFS